MNQMLIRAGNLILASLAFFITAMAETGCSRRTTRSLGMHTSVTISEVIADLIVLYWFVGALGLFSRKRFYWFGSLVGAGASACFFAVTLASTVWKYIFPDAEMDQLRNVGEAAYIATLVIGIMEFSVLLAATLGVFIGVLRMRKELR